MERPVPKNINDNLDSIISALIKDAELEEERRLSSGLKGLQNIIKPYPNFHWQNLHPKLHSLVFPYYISEDYYSAVYQGVIKYKNEVRTKTSSLLTDRALLENIFSIKNSKLSVTKKFKKVDGSDFEKDTIININEGHRNLVIAMWQAFRDPLAHETVKDLKNSGLYSEQDCFLMHLSCSHLFRRLDNSEPS